MPVSFPRSMRQQANRLLGEAAQTSDLSQRRKLASRAFALAQNAEAVERKAVEQRQEAPAK